MFFLSCTAVKTENFPIREKICFFSMANFSKREIGECCMKPLKTEIDRRKKEDENFSLD